MASPLGEVLKKHYRERYRLWLITRDPKYLNQDGLTKDEVEKIRTDEYNKMYKSKK